MSNMPKITVIIPVFNAQKYLLESIESVLNQTLKEIEIIVVNDGSTDQSLEILESISLMDNRLIVLNQKNKGQSIASNKALEIARGDYIKYFDADDVMNDSHLEKLYEKIKNKNDVLVSCKWARFYNDDLRNAKFISCSTWTDLHSIDWITNAMSEKYDMMPLWLWLIPKKLLLKVGGWDESLTLNNDFEFSIRLLTSVSFVYFEDEAIIYYRSGHSNTLSAKKVRNYMNRLFSLQN
jgi:glycosyltransferase involved in cell wall biosynthesis